MSLTKREGIKRGWPTVGGQFDGLRDLTLITNTFGAGASSGTLISPILGKAIASTLTINPSDTRVAITGNDINGYNLVVGSTPSSAGNFSITLVETKSGVSGSPKSTPITLYAVALGLTGALTYNTTDTAGTVVANITGVPTGITPTISPADGRVVIGGSEGAGWKVLKGSITSIPGSIDITVSAFGLNPVSSTVPIVDTNAPSWATLKSQAASILYVSNEASNGYGLGNDTTGNGTKATPYLTIDKACAIGADGVLIEINPGSSPYQENTASAGYLRPNAAKEYVFGSDPTYGRAVIKCTGSVARVILLDASAKKRTFANLIIDAQGTSGGNAISTGGAVTGGVFFYNCIGRNSSGSWFQKPTGTLNIVNMVNCSFENTTHLIFSATGGNYTTIKLQGNNFANDNQVYKGAVGGSVDTFEVTGNTFTAHTSGTGIGILCGGETIGTLNFTGNNATGTFAGALLNISHPTTITLLTATLNTGMPSAGMLLNNSENVAQCNADYNNLVIDVGQSQDSFTFRIVPTIFRARFNTIRVNAVASTKHGISMGGDGYIVDNTNTNATTSQAFGSTSANAYVSQSFTMASDTTSIKASYLAAILFKMQRVGSPTGTISAKLYTDNAGVPGTLIETSTNVLSASTIPTTAGGSITGFEFQNHYRTTGSTKYHVVLQYTGTNDGTNYISLISGTVVTGGNLCTSTNGTSWTTDATHSIWNEVDTGSFGTTYVEISDNTVTAPSNANSLTHGILCGAVNLNVYARNYYTGPGIGHLFKNTFAASGSGIVSDNLASVVGGQQAAMYLKGCRGLFIYHNTLLQSSTDINTAAAMSIGSNSELGINAKVATATIKNNIIQNTGIGAAYTVDIGGLSGVTITNNVVYASGTSFGIERQAYASWSAWQTAGADASSVNSNPLLASTQSAVSDFIPPNNSPVANVGTNLVSVVPTDYKLVAFSTTPPAGALNLAP